MASGGSAGGVPGASGGSAGGESGATDVGLGATDAGLCEDFGRTQSKSPNACSSGGADRSSAARRCAGGGTGGGRGSMVNWGFRFPNERAIEPNWFRIALGDKGLEPKAPI